MPPRRVHHDADRDDDEVRVAPKGYTWETTGVRSWDQIVEDPETGRLKSFQRAEQIAAKRRRDDAVSGVRRGIIRFTVLVVDSSAALAETDLKPSRAEAVCAACGEYVREYFDQNPISQLAVVTTRDGVAARLSGLSSNPDLHIDAIQEVLRLGPYGEPSLMNALALARTLLAPIPAYGTREVVVAYGALATCDPGDIHTVVSALADDKVRVSAVGLAAEMTILRTLAAKTGGVYRVALGGEHFAELMAEHVIPPPTTAGRTPASLIRMGFPMLKRLPEPRRFWNNPDLRPRRLGYECPRRNCGAWLSEMPCECVLCGLTLVSSPHLARSYHHLFPVPKFRPLPERERRGDGSDEEGEDDDEEEDDDDAMKDVEAQQPGMIVRCTGCLKLLPRAAALRLECPRCKNIFCLDCDAFVHDGLHHCPGCGADNSTSVLAN